LHEGNTESKVKNLRSRLERAGYVAVPATVIPTDWEFNWGYRDHSEDSSVLEGLQRLYLEHVGKVLDYSEKQSELVFGRQIKHFLRLHLGIATANFIRPLLAFLEARGYHFITPEEALSDPAYETHPELVTPLGLTFIDRVAAAKGLAFDPDHARLTRRQIARMLENQASDPQ
jgi:hypothetical protein